ncbi:MAG: UTP--glucose-phosphate uridylyltransferase [Acidimicrobiaceae bacterium]|jgi:UTP--glucose-1-phosphate uridylyltransferase
MSVTKAVIPAAGLGTRFLPATKSSPKEMLPIVDKPSIQYVVEEAVACGIDDILIVTGRSKKTLEDHFDRTPELEAELAAKGKHEALEQVRAISELADVHYVRQGEPLGLGHAVSMARKHIGDSSFVVLLPDDIIHPRVPLLRDMIATHERLGAAVIALLQVDDPSLYGVVEPGPRDGDVIEVLGVVEKPPKGTEVSDLAVMGRYVFTPAIFDALERITPGAGGELQLTDAYAQLIGAEGLFGQIFTEGRYDAGNKLDYLRAVVELAAEHDDLGPDFRSFLADFVKRTGLA